MHHILCALLLFALLNFSINCQQQLEHNAPHHHLPTKISDFLHSQTVPSENSQAFEGKKWALLVAGSLGYENYRHQADVCHAYQILKKGGLKDENIIVFMYDDIAFNSENPRPGVIINTPTGGNVYEGVPKDYTGNDTSIHNLFAVILGNKSALTGGSGKVLDSGPKDHIFIYYSDHGAPGLISMPSDEYVYADDLIKVLKKKHESNSYASMVFYLEACESGSMFDGLLPENLNIYATTAANSTEDSFATYCSDEDPFIPSEFNTTDTVCLGDMYSVAWMEDSERHDLRSETLEQQFQVVKRRTVTENMDQGHGSHVMHYGSQVLSKEFLYSYMGTSHANDNYTLSRNSVAPYRVKSISQREADLFYYWQKVKRAPKGSARMVEARKQLKNEIDRRTLVDDNIKQMSNILFGDKIVHDVMLLSVRPSGQPLVDDWTCLKSIVKTYEKYCGSLSRYGMKYTRAFANMCNAGITVEQVIMASARSCK